jgi:hypothetical protein
MTSKDKHEDPEAFEQRIKEICATYEEAVALEANGTHVVSCDEKTSIQAVERKRDTLPTRPGLIERREHEYVRHGTLCLTANFFVATGRVLYSTVGLTRTEEDFASHIRNTVASDRKADWVFVVDQLNTHMSEELVRLVAGLCNLDIDLGDKGKRGILKSMKSRRAFLSDASHRIRFQYTPRHCSWLNQVEIWFSILARRVVKRGNFSSIDDLRGKLLAFIDYFNATLAKPFRWTYAGKLLRA